MKTITLEELRKVRVGDKVKIVNERPVNPRCGWAEPAYHDEGMDVYLGKICTVESIDKHNIELPVLRLAEDDRHYSWTEDMIELVIYQKQFNSLSDAVNNVLKDILNSRKQFNFVKAIEKVIYSKPATIIIWADGAKTTAKCAEGETYDPEKGLVICALKKFVSAEAIMNLLQFTREGNGTVTYKDVLNRNRVDKKKKVKTFTIDCTDKSNAEIKSEIVEIKAKVKKEISKK